MLPIALGRPESQIQKDGPCFGGQANMDYGNFVSESHKAYGDELVHGLLRCGRVRVLSISRTPRIPVLLQHQTLTALQLVYLSTTSVAPKAKLPIKERLHHVCGTVEGAPAERNLPAFCVQPYGTVLYRVPHIL